MISLVCPVRSCATPLQRAGTTLSCERGHSFDVAKSGYVNLLQPQDKKSARPGDSRAAALARRRLLDRGAGRAVLDEIETIVRDRHVDHPLVLLDAGCGEGSHLGGLTARLGAHGGGVDISAAAIDLAARRFPELTWIVANADRFLPVATSSVDVVLSITARINPAETERILRPGGMAIVAVAAPDDLRELRALVMGEAVEKERMARVVQEMSGRFALAERRHAVDSLSLDIESLRDLLLTTYRGQRRSQSARLDGAEEMTITSSLDVLVFERA